MDRVIVAGLALGALYALTAMVYNTMYSTSKVLSFGAGQFAMVGGIACAWAMLSLHQPLWLGFAVVIAGGAIFGALTEVIAVRGLGHLAHEEDPARFAALEREIAVKHQVLPTTS